MLSSNADMHIFLFERKLSSYRLLVIALERKSLKFWRLGTCVVLTTWEPIWVLSTSLLVFGGLDQKLQRLGLRRLVVFVVCQYF